MGASSGRSAGPDGPDPLAAANAPRRGRPRMHPGRLLREVVLPALKTAGHTQQDVADKLGVSRQALVNLATEKAAVTPEMALRLGKLCGNGPEVWLALQRSWELEQAAARLSAEVARIPTLRVDQAA